MQYTYSIYGTTIPMLAHNESTIIFSSVWVFDLCTLLFSFLYSEIFYSLLNLTFFMLQFAFGVKM